MFSFLRSKTTEVPGEVNSALEHNDSKAEVVSHIHPNVLSSYDKNRENEGPFGEALDYLGDLTQYPHSYVPLGENQLTLNCAANIVKFMYQRHQFNLSTDNARREDLKQRMRRELFALNENSLALMAESQINVDPEG